MKLYALCTCVFVGLLSYILTNRGIDKALNGSLKIGMSESIIFFIVHADRIVVDDTVFIYSLFSRIKTLKFLVNLLLHWLNCTNQMSDNRIVNSDVGNWKL